MLAFNVEKLREEQASGAPVPNRGGVSYVIRTYNEAEFIGRLLAVLASQEGIPPESEIIIVDSGSTDQTVAIAERWPVKVLKIPKDKFDYSQALNLGTTNARGQLIVNLSAHAIPSGNSWLARMVSHFADPSVAGVYCRQLPWPDVSSREARRIKSDFGDQPVTHDRIVPGKRVSFTNSACCLRRCLWEKHPFRLPWAEDSEWANWAVASGYKILYEPSVAVFHSHNLTPRQDARRLINGEKAVDRELRRRRTAGFTFRQAAGHAYRDLKELWQLGASEPKPLRAGCEALARAFWFLCDFER